MIADPQYARDLKENVRRHEEEYLRFYKPRGAQIEAHKSPAEIRLVHSPNQWGKSFWLRAEIAWTVGKVHPYRKNHVGPVYARHCCKDFQVMESVVIPGYFSLLPRKQCEINGLQWPGLRGGTWETAWSAQGRTIFLADGSLIEFKSYDQDIQSYAGPPRHVVGHDEEPPRPLYEENVARQVTFLPTFGMNQLFAMTPLNYSAWLYQLYTESAKNQKIACFKGSLRDIPGMTDEQITALELQYDDPAERAARVHGEFTFTEGRVWKGYGEHNVCDPIPIKKNWHVTVVIDPHPEKATGVIAVAQDDRGVGYVFWEAEIKGDVQTICDTINAGVSGHWVSTWLIDPSSRQSTGIHGKGRLIDEFRRYIPWVLEANNDRLVGWDTVAKLVKNDPVSGPKLYVFRSCPITDSQMRNYSWKPPLASGEARGKPDVVKRNDEMCDCVRYWAMQTRHNWTNTEPFEGFDIEVLHG